MFKHFIRSIFGTCKTPEVPKTVPVEIENRPQVAKVVPVKGFLMRPQVSFLDHSYIYHLTQFVERVRRWLITANAAQTGYLQE